MYRLATSLLETAAIQANHLKIIIKITYEKMDVANWWMVLSVIYSIIVFVITIGQDTTILYNVHHILYCITILILFCVSFSYT